MTPRSEPLLWLQLLALGAIPLELLLLLLMLAGADPGPVPGVERLLVWTIAVLSPALLFWRRPPDFCSLLLIQVPLRGRSQLQRSLSSMQTALLPRLLSVLGAALLLPLLWTLDSHAALAASLSPLQASNRFIVLLLTIPLLALVLWQWQQATQALWLLSRSGTAVEQAAAMSISQLEEQRLCLGLPLLLLEPLLLPAGVVPPPGRQDDLPEEPAIPRPGTTTGAGGAPAPVEPTAALQTAAPSEVPAEQQDPDPADLVPTAPELEAAPVLEATPELEAGLALEADPEAESGRAAEADPEATPVPAPEEGPPTPSVTLDDGGPVAVEPEQAAEQTDGSQLDQDIP